MSHNTNREYGYNQDTSDEEDEDTFAGLALENNQRSKDGVVKRTSSSTSEESTDKYNDNSKYRPTERRPADSTSLLVENLGEKVVFDNLQAANSIDWSNDGVICMQTKYCLHFYSPLFQPLTMYQVRWLEIEPRTKVEWTGKLLDTQTKDQGGLFDEWMNVRGRSADTVLSFTEPCPLTRFEKFEGLRLVCISDGTALLICWTSQVSSNCELIRNTDYQLKLNGVRVLCDINHICSSTSLFSTKNNSSSNSSRSSAAPETTAVTAPPIARAVLKSACWHPWVHRSIEPLSGIGLSDALPFLLLVVGTSEGLIGVIKVTSDWSSNCSSSSSSDKDSTCSHNAKATVIQSFDIAALLRQQIRSAICLSDDVCINSLKVLPFEPTSAEPNARSAAADHYVCDTNLDDDDAVQFVVLFSTVCGTVGCLLVALNKESKGSSYSASNSNSSFSIRNSGSDRDVFHSQNKGDLSPTLSTSPHHIKMTVQWTHSMGRPVEQLRLLDDNRLLAVCASDVLELFLTPDLRTMISCAVISPLTASSAHLWGNSSNVKQKQDQKQDQLEQQQQQNARNESLGVRHKKGSITGLTVLRRSGVVPTAHQYSREFWVDFFSSHGGGGIVAWGKEEKEKEKDKENATTAPALAMAAAKSTTATVPSKSTTDTYVVIPFESKATAVQKTCLNARQFGVAIDPTGMLMIAHAVSIPAVFENSRKVQLNKYIKKPTSSMSVLPASTLFDDNFAESEVKMSNLIWLVISDAEFLCGKSLCTLPILVIESCKKLMFKINLPDNLAEIISLNREILIKQRDMTRRAGQHHKVGELMPGLTYNRKKTQKEASRIRRLLAASTSAAAAKSSHHNMRNKKRKGQEANDDDDDVYGEDDSDAETADDKDEDDDDTNRKLDSNYARRFEKAVSGPKEVVHNASRKPLGTSSMQVLKRMLEMFGYGGKENVVKHVCKQIERASYLINQVIHQQQDTDYVPISIPIQSSTSVAVYPFTARDFQSVRRRDYNDSTTHDMKRSVWSRGQQVLDYIFTGVMPTTDLLLYLLPLEQKKEVLIKQVLLWKVMHLLYTAPVRSLVAPAVAEALVGTIKRLKEVMIIAHACAALERRLVSATKSKTAHFYSFTEMQSMAFMLMILKTSTEADQHPQVQTVQSGKQVNLSLRKESTVPSVVHVTDVCHRTIAVLRKEMRGAVYNASSNNKDQKRAGHGLVVRRSRSEEEDEAEEEEEERETATMKIISARECALEFKELLSSPCSICSEDRGVQIYSVSSSSSTFSSSSSSSSSARVGKNSSNEAFSINFDPLRPLNSICSVCEMNFERCCLSFHLVTENPTKGCVKFVERRDTAYSSSSVIPPPPCNLRIVQCPSCDSVVNETALTVIDSPRAGYSTCGGGASTGGYSTCGTGANTGKQCNKPVSQIDDKTVDNIENELPSLSWLGLTEGSRLMCPFCGITMLDIA